MALNGTSASVTSWSDTSIGAVVPSGATSGTFAVTVNGIVATSGFFQVGPLSGWLDQDVGLVGVPGSASFANAKFTVQAGGQEIGDSTDAMHFVYQPLSGDGTIVARVASIQGVLSCLDRVLGAMGTEAVYQLRDPRLQVVVLPQALMWAYFPIYRRR